jgi:2,4-didehydro-3-deoxy-L-rhamnonate hydrolase
MSWYALASYQTDGRPSTAIAVGDKLYDMAAVHQAVNGDQAGAPSWLNSLEDIIDQWDDCGDDVRALAECAAGGAGAESAAGVASAEVTDGAGSLLAPIHPARIYAAASNYVEHANEMGTVLATKSESNPFVFMKADTSVIGPGDTVIIPSETKMPDWEVELGVVIGRKARKVSVNDALDYVFGYTIVNDVTARDLNKRSDYPFAFDWFQGKSFDTFAPLGPWIVPASLIADPQALNLSLSVNGEPMQDATTAEMIFTVAEQIAYLSNILTLHPGDVIASGTPTGVGMGRGIFLKHGDVMVASVENIGDLTNPVADES